MKGLFFDACATMLAKNLLPIANIFKEKDSNFKAVFVSADTGGNTDLIVESNSIKNIEDNEGFYYLSFKSFNRFKIQELIKNEKPDFLFIGAYRIYDQLWISICRRNNVKVFSQQHGFEIDSVFYNSKAIIGKINKVLRLTYAAYNLSKSENISFLLLFYQYCKYILHGTSLKNTLLGSSHLHPDIGFVYSNYYKIFWYNKFGFDKDKMRIIMPVDFLLIKSVLKQKREMACCYITQTLVEDGRLLEKDFIELMKSYRLIATIVDKFIVKLHPQANKEIYYKLFGDIKNVEFTREFPNAKIYLTHYSSMAFTAALLSNNVILHEIKGHPTHDIFKKITSKVAFSTDEVIQQIKDSNDDVPDIDKRKLEIEDYCVFNEKNPFSEIYNYVVEELAN